jgi:hypothetical protein
MQFYSHNGCTGSIDTENKGTGRFSYTQPNGITANQCYYFADPSSSSKPKKIGSFHGIANGKYTISWYRGKDCSSKNKIASSSKGKYVKLDKADKPPLGFISFRVSHADTKGPLGREVFCGQKIVRGKKPHSLKKQLETSKKVCFAIQKKCGAQETPSHGVCRPVYRPSSKLDGDCEILNAEQRAWYIEECGRHKGYSCKRRTGGSGTSNAIVSCRKAVGFVSGGFR